MGLSLYVKNMHKNVMISKSQKYAVEKIQIMKQNWHFLYLGQKILGMELQWKCSYYNILKFGKMRFMKAGFSITGL